MILTAPKNFSFPVVYSLVVLQSLTPWGADMYIYVCVISTVLAQLVRDTKVRIFPARANR